MHRYAALKDLLLICASKVISGIKKLLPSNGFFAGPNSHRDTRRGRLRVVEWNSIGGEKVSVE